MVSTGGSLPLRAGACVMMEHEVRPPTYLPLDVSECRRSEEGKREVAGPVEESCEGNGFGSYVQGDNLWWVNPARCQADIGMNEDSERGWRWFYDRKHKKLGVA